MIHNIIYTPYFYPLQVLLYLTNLSYTRSMDSQYSTGIINTNRNCGSISNYKMYYHDLDIP